MSTLYSNTVPHLKRQRLPNFLPPKTEATLFTVRWSRPRAAATCLIVIVSPIKQWIYYADS